MKQGLVSFILRRIILLFVVLFSVVTIVFVITRVIPVNLAKVWAGPRASDATAEVIARIYHLNDPIYLQYFYYLMDLLRGDWGHTPFSGVPVIFNIQNFLPATIELTLISLLIAIAIGIPLGVISATNRDKAVDHVARLLSLVSVASPPFLLSLLLQFVLFYQLGIFPESGGRISIAVEPPGHITGLYLLDSLITLNWTAFQSSLQHIIMPSFALAFLIFGLVSRLTRASMLEILTSDYVRTAKSKGLSRRVVVYKHALRNALIPPTTALAVYMAYLLGGAVVVEAIFSWPGMGRYTYHAILNLDFPSVMGTTIVFSVGVALSSLISDILNAILDPRIRLDS